MDGGGVKWGPSQESVIGHQAVTKDGGRGEKNPAVIKLGRLRAGLGSLGKGENEIPITVKVCHSKKKSHS